MGHFGKCHNGQCPLTANPLRGALWGIFIAALAAYPLLMNAFRKPVPASENVIHLKPEENLKEMIGGSGKIALIDFYADWCGPCRSLAPTINKVADEYKGTVSVIKINIDQIPALAKEYNATSIPTVIITKNGQEVERIVGARNFDTYSDILRKLVLHNKK